MKKLISLLTLVAILSTLLCGCLPFNGNNNGTDNRISSVLQIPNKGQTYYKRVVYSANNSASPSIKTTCLNSYLAINGSKYDAERGNDYISVIFDTNGNLVYDGAKNGRIVDSVLNGKVLVKEIMDNDQILLINNKNGEETKFFEGYTPFIYKDGYWSVTDNRNGKSGIIDENGNIVIPCKYDKISSFDDKGGAIVSDANGEYKMGMIDKNNNFLVPQKYLFLWSYNGEPAFNGTDRKPNLSYEGYGTTYDYTIASFDGGKKIKVIDRNDNEVFDFSSSGYNLAPIFVSGSFNLIPIESDGLYGFIDMHGNQVIPPKYNRISCDFVNGYACVAIGKNYGVINLKDETIIPFEYNYISAFDQKGFAIAKLKNDTKSTIIDLAGNIIYQTDNNMESLGYGFFRDGSDIILLTTDGSDYTTYEPVVYTKK